MRWVLLVSLGILTSRRNETTEDSSDSESEGDMTPCTPLQAALHRKQLAEKQKKKATSSNATGADTDSLEEVLTKRLQEYLNQDFDPEHELRMQCKGMGKIQTTLTGRE